MIDGKRKKIAFIVQRYGREVNGGAEYYTNQMVQHLKSDYEVEVLTSKALTYDKWADYYMSDVEEIDGIIVRRFGVKWKRNRYIQRLLKECIVRLGGNCLWLTKLWNKALGPYVPGLVEYIEGHQAEYDVFVFVTYMYYPTVFGMEKVKDKAVFVPTAHDEYNIYFKVYERIFHIPRQIVYLTEEERAFVEGQFHNADVKNKVAGVGIDLPGQVDGARFREKYGITGDYIIYAGRVDEDKGCGEMFDYFLRYTRKGQPEGSSGKDCGKLQLVVIGKKYMDIPTADRIRYLGFVPDQDKYDGIAGAKLLWLPSRFESLSIAVLEAMALGTPVIVNGNSSVLKAHCEKSGGGWYYDDFASYEASMRALEGLEGVEYDDLCRNGERYVEEFYQWDKVIGVWGELMERIERNP